MIQGIDVSFAQGTINWDQVKASGQVEFAYSRVSYGTNPADDDGPIFVANHDGAKAQGIPFGSYFFWLMGQDGQAQAQHFIEAANGRYGELYPMIDVEEGSGVQGWGASVNDRILNLSAAVEYVTEHLAKPLIYTNSDTWASYFGKTDAFSGHLLYVASFGTPPGSPVVPQGFDSWAIHQYSDSGSIPGISGNVDLDCCLDLAEITRP